MTSAHATERFAVEGRVAGGAMGELFKAQDLKTGQPVAIKVLRSSTNKTFAARFRREISVLAELRHPNVVTYVDHGVWDDGRPYLAMEWLEGEDLQARTKRAPLGMADAIEVVRRAASALAAIHSRGIVHRDLKLDNIWLCPGKGWPVKLIDFGVVKLPEKDEYSTEPGSIIGTPQYMAPEQARGADVTPRSDVYALGAVLFRLVTGRVVFPTDHIVALLGQLVLEDPPHPNIVRFDVPELLDEVIFRCISRKPEDRFEDAGELSRVLARIRGVPNEPPNREGSSSAIRAIPLPRPSGSMAAMAPLNQRRVVVTVLASLANAEQQPMSEHAIAPFLRPGDVLEHLQGERVLAAFGLQTTHGDDLLRAARAALALATQVPDIRVAIASGQSTRATRGVSSAALERAALQLDRTAAGGIRVDPTTSSLLAGRFVLRDDTAGAVLVGEDAIGSAARKLLGKPVPAVGRDKEIALLLALLDESVDEQAPRGALVLGVPGIGKSRVRRELVSKLTKRDAPATLFLAQGDPLRGASSIGCLARAMRTLMNIREGEATANQISKVKHFLAARIDGPTAADDLFFLCELVGVPIEMGYSSATDAARQNPSLMHRHIRSMLERLVRGQAKQGPIVFLFDDVQWADAQSLDLVDWLLGCSGLPLVVYAFGRSLPDGRTSLWADRTVTRLDLSPLSRAACEKLIAAVLPMSSDEMRRALAERSGGNALFLEELIRVSVEGGEEQAAHPGGLPLTIHAVVQARLDALDDDLREVVQAASVVGKVFWNGAVAALLDRLVDAQLEKLASAEVITPVDTTRFDGQREWTFRHALVRDVAYASLLEDEAMGLHHRAALWFEASGEKDLAAIAEHFRVAGQGDRAAELFTKSALSSVKSGNLDAALTLAEHGLKLCTDPAMIVTLQLVRADASGWRGRYGDQIDAAQSVIASNPSETQHAHAAALLAWAQRDTGKLEESRVTLKATDSIDLSTLSPSLRIALLAEKARTFAMLGQLDAAREASTTAVAEAQRHHSAHDPATLRALDSRVVVSALAGDLGALIDACRQVISSADAVGDVPLSLRGRVNLGYALNCVGRYDEAYTVLERAVRDATSVRMRPQQGFALHNMGMSLARLGRIEDALGAQREARGLAENIGHHTLLAATYQYESLALAWRGAQADLVHALEVAREAIRLSREHPMLFNGAVAVMTVVQQRRKAFHAAIEAAGEFPPLDTGAGAFEWDAMLCVALVESLLAVESEDEAVDTAQQGMKRMQVRAMSLGDAKERELFLQNIPENVRLATLAAQLGGS